MTGSNITIQLRKPNLPSRSMLTILISLILLLMLVLLITRSNETSTSPNNLEVHDEAYQLDIPENWLTAKTETFTNIIPPYLAEFFEVQAIPGTEEEYNGENSTVITIEELFGEDIITLINAEQCVTVAEADSGLELYRGEDSNAQIDIDGLTPKNVKSTELNGNKACYYELHITDGQPISFKVHLITNNITSYSLEIETIGSEDHKDHEIAIDAVESFKF